MTLERIQLIRKAILLVIFIAFFLLFCISAPIYPDEGIIRFVKWSGLVLIVFCIIGRTWSSSFIGGRKLYELVKSGPYSVCRNPLYVFSTIGAAGAGMLSGSIVLGMLLAVIVAIVFSVVVRREEAGMLAIHGIDFQEYMVAVPRFIPSCSLWDAGDAGIVETKYLIRTLLDAIWILTAIPAFMLIQYFQLSGLLPVLLRLP